MEVERRTLRMRIIQYMSGTYFMTPTPYRSAYFKVRNYVSTSMARKKASKVTNKDEAALPPLPSIRIPTQIPTLRDSGLLFDAPHPYPVRHQLLTLYFNFLSLRNISTLERYYCMDSEKTSFYRDTSLWPPISQQSRCAVGDLKSLLVRAHRG